jgi:hypothetical protein
MERKVNTGWSAVSDYDEVQMGDDSADKKATMFRNLAYYAKDLEDTLDAYKRVLAHSLNR